MGWARRKALELIEALGFDETEAGRVAITVTELANNLVKHARGGSLIFRRLEQGGSFGFEVLSVDRGPGMVSVTNCLRDGYSTAGSSGTGLGAVKRLSNVFDVYSNLENGTVILSQHWTKNYEHAFSQNAQELETGAVCLPNLGETECGDGWGLNFDSGRNLLMVADGLGHGPKAAEASSESIRILAVRNKMRAVEIMSAAHDALKKTRGAAVALTDFHADRKTVSYVSVGNIMSAVISPSLGAKRLGSQNGTIGMQVPRFQEFNCPWSSDSIFLMHSDGLISHWKIENYAGLLLKHPSVIAAVFYRDYRRGTDDVTVVVAKQRESRFQDASA